MSQSVKRYLHIVEYVRSINRRNVGFGSEDLERRVERPLVAFVRCARDRRWWISNVRINFVQFWFIRFIYEWYIYIFDWSNIITRRILIYMIYVTNDFDGSCQYNLTFSFSKLLAFSKTLIILFVYVIITSTFNFLLYIITLQVFYIIYGTNLKQFLAYQDFLFILISRIDGSKDACSNILTSYVYILVMESRRFIFASSQQRLHA